jgi:hypothetical protein
MVHATRKRTKRMITSLHKSEGTTLTTHQEIRNYICLLLRVWVWENDNRGGHDKTSGSIGFPRIMPQGNVRLAEPITVEELQKGNRQRSSEQSLGADGIVHEFYVHFWDVIKRTCWPFTIRSYETEISTQRKHLARLLCAEASGTAYHERLPRIDVIQYRL